MEGHRVKLTEVNPYLVCVLCQGYLVDATTVAECLHSFCRSCIFRQLARESVCPICKTAVLNTKLHRSLRPDKTLQDIVYKLVPGLFHNEMQRRRDFYKQQPYRDLHLEPERRGVCLDRLIYSPKDQISLSLEFYDEEREKEEWSNQGSPKPAQTAPSGPKRYLQCPAGFKMYHLKKFLRQKYGLSPSCNVDIMYRRECLPDSYSLMDVAYIYTWKRNSPMRFYYRMPDVVMKRLLAPPSDLPRLSSAEPSTKLALRVGSDQNPSLQSSDAKSNVNQIIRKDLYNLLVNKKKEAEEKHKNQSKKDVDECNNEKGNLDPENNTEKSIEIPEEKTAEIVSKGDSETSKAHTGDETSPVKEINCKSNEVSSSETTPSISKEDELPVSVVQSLDQSPVENKSENNLVSPQGSPTQNGVIDKKPNKISLKLSVNKIAADLAEYKARQQNSENIRANAQVSQKQRAQKRKPIVPKPYQKPKHIQPKQPLMEASKQQLLILKQQHQQQKQQQLQQQKQQIQQIIQQQQELQIQIEQQQQQLQLQQQQKYLQQQQKLQQQQQKYQIQQQQLQMQQVQIPHQQVHNQFQNQTNALSPQQRVISQPNQIHIIYDGQPIQMQQSHQQPQLLQVAQQTSQSLQVAQQTSQPLQVAQQPSQSHQVAQQPSLILHVTQQPSQSLQVTQQPSQTLQIPQQTSQSLQVAQQQSLQVAQQTPQSLQGADKPSPSLQVNQQQTQSLQGAQKTSQPPQAAQQQSNTLQVNQQQPQSFQINSKALRPQPTQQNATSNTEVKTTKNNAINSLNKNDSNFAPKSTNVSAKGSPLVDPVAHQKEPVVLGSAAKSPPAQKQISAEKPASPPPATLLIKTPPLRPTPPLRQTSPPQLQPIQRTALTTQLQHTQSPRISGSLKNHVDNPTSSGSSDGGTENGRSSIGHMSGENVNFIPSQSEINGIKQSTPPLILQDKFKLAADSSKIQQEKPHLPDAESSSVSDAPKGKSPQVTLNTSNGSLTIMAQVKNNQIPSSPSSNPLLVNGSSPDPTKPQGIHQNLPRTVLPKSPFINGKPTQKVVQQKNISGQRLNNNLSGTKNGIIQQSNINNRLPTFQKSGGRKTGSPGGLASKTGTTLEERIQQLYKAGQTNKAPSPSGKSESRLGSWLNNRFKTQSLNKEATEPNTPTPPTKELSMIRYKRKLQDQNGQEVCEITQENPRPDDAKRRREVMPDVSIELMRAADIKKLEGASGVNKKEKRPVPGLKSIQEVGVKRKKEDESVLDLSSAKPGDTLQSQVPWVLSRPPHFIPRST